MQAGKLQHVIDIEAPAERQDSIGGTQHRFVPKFTGIRARVLKVIGAERLQQTEVQGQIDATIEIRWRPGVTEKMRVRHVWDRGTNSVDYYDIQAVVPMGTDRRKILLYCRAWGAENAQAHNTLPNIKEP